MWSYLTFHVVHTQSKKRSRARQKKNLEESIKGEKGSNLSHLHHLLPTLLSPLPLHLRLPRNPRPYHTKRRTGQTRRTKALSTRPTLRENRSSNGTSNQNPQSTGKHVNSEPRPNTAHLLGRRHRSHRSTLQRNERSREEAVQETPHHQARCGVADADPAEGEDGSGSGCGGENLQGVKVFISNVGREDATGNGPDVEKDEHPEFEAEVVFGSILFNEEVRDVLPDEAEEGGQVHDLKGYVFEDLCVEYFTPSGWTDAGFDDDARDGEGEQGYETDDAHCPAET